MAGGCATSFAHRVKPPPSQDGKEVCYIENVLPRAQTAYQCGPAALGSVLHYWGRNEDADTIGSALYRPGTLGVLNFTLATYAKDLGFWAEMPQADEPDLKEWIRRGIPPIVMLDTGALWARNYHFVVLRGFNDREQIYYANTGQPDTQAIPYAELRKRWGSPGKWCLIVCPARRVRWEGDAARDRELAFFLERSGDLALAGHWYRASLRKDPDNDIAKFDLGNIYLKTGRWNRAEKIYSELLRKGSLSGRPGIGESVLYNNLAWVYLRQGLPSDAARTVEAAFRGGAERRYDILDTAGLAYCALNRPDQARNLFMEALQKAPIDDPETLEVIRKHLGDCGPV